MYLFDSKMRISQVVFAWPFYFRGQRQRTQIKVPLHAIWWSEACDVASATSLWGRKAYRAVCSSSFQSCMLSRLLQTGTSADSTNRSTSKAAILIGWNSSSSALFNEPLPELHPTQDTWPCLAMMVLVLRTTSWIERWEMWHRQTHSSFHEWLCFTYGSDRARLLAW